MERDIPKLCVAHFFGEVPAEGVVLDEWPSHMTLVKPFRLGGSTSPEDVVEAVGAVAKIHRPLLLTPIGYEMFGPPEKPAEQAPAVKICRTEGLHKLHLDLVHAIEGLGIVISDRRWMAEAYNPHSTIKNGVELIEPRMCDHVTVSLKILGREVVAKTVWLK